MRLSEAMMLGSTTCKMEAGDWNSCALGAAGNAIGIPQARVIGIEYFMEDGSYRSEHLFSAWPWVFTFMEPRPVWMIFDLSVCTGEITFEQLVDYVRSIEPECGDCNSFYCTCVQKMDESQLQPAETFAY